MRENIVSTFHLLTTKDLPRSKQVICVEAA